MKSSSCILFLVGGGIIVAPMAFLYLTYRLSAQTLLEAIDKGRDWDKVNFHPIPPEYYFPVCLLIGFLCIGSGVVLAFREPGSIVREADFTRLDLD